MNIKFDDYVQHPTYGTGNFSYACYLLQCRSNNKNLIFIEFNNEGVDTTTRVEPGEGTIIPVIKNDLYLINDV